MKYIQSECRRSIWNLIERRFVHTVVTADQHLSNDIKQK